VLIFFFKQKIADIIYIYMYRKNECIYIYSDLFFHDSLRVGN
jgi:hypothetical protein